MPPQGLMLVCYVAALVGTVSSQEMNVEIDQEAAVAQRQTKMFACTGVARFWVNENEALIAKVVRRSIHQEENILEKIMADIVLRCYKEIELDLATELMQKQAINPNDPAVKQWTVVDFDQFYRSRSIELSKEQQDLISITEVNEEKRKKEAEEATEPVPEPLQDPILAPWMYVTALGVLLLAGYFLLRNRTNTKLVQKTNNKKQK